MDRKSFRKNELPDSPGVYYFLGRNKKILYIGKATSLKNRVASYFSNDIKEKRSVLIEKMVEESEVIEYTSTDSVLEALILESNLIRTHKPYYNTKSKDDKTYNHLVITNEDWPRLLVVRESDLTEKFEVGEIKYQFGPFPSVALFREALKIIRKLFKYYDTKSAVGSEKTKMAKGKIDFNRQLGLYPDLTDKKEYLKTIRHLKLFFEGKKKKIIQELEQEMMKQAKVQNFEKAKEIKNRLFALRHIEDIALIKNDKKTDYNTALFRIEAYDVAHHGGKEMVGVMVVVQNTETQKSEYRKFKIKSVSKANDPAALKEMLRRRFQHQEWPRPGLLVVDGNIIQINAAKAVLHEFELGIPVVSVVKDDRHKVKGILPDDEITEKYKFEILLANSEAHRFSIAFHRQAARKKLLK